MQNFVRNNKWLWAVKIIAALFQIPATWNVFVKNFKAAGRPDLEAYITTFFAILLIDVFFLAVLYLLESEELDPIKKIPWALVGVGLLVATLLIGFTDEGLFAWMPRVGFIGLVCADLFTWAADFIALMFNRDRIEKRVRDRQVVARRRVMQKAWKAAQKDLYEDLVNLQYERERRSLGMVPKGSTVSSDSEQHYVEDGIVFLPSSFGHGAERQHRVPKGSTVSSDSEQHYVEDGIVFLPSSNSYGWEDDAGQIFYRAVNGKNYTLRGAKLARTRSKRNGR